MEDSGVQLSNQVALPKCWPKRNDCIKYLDQSDDMWKEVKVLGPAGKRSGGNKSWFNVQNGENVKYSIDLDSVGDWKVAENQEVLMASSHDGFLDAKLDELKRWKEFNAYEEV